MGVTLAFIAGLILAGILVYANTFQGSFVFDDINFITKNDPDVHMTRFSWDALKRAALEGNPRNRYLPNISFAFNYYLGGETTFGYHLVNLAIHLISGIVLFFLFRLTWRLCLSPSGGSSVSSVSSEASVFRKPPKGFLSVSPDLPAFLAALIWLVHPVQTNAVTYICQRMASMVAMFYILALLCYILARIRMQTKKIRPAAGLFAGCAFFSLCAVATKENAGTLPVSILLYEWFFFQNLKVSRSSRTWVWVIAGAMAFAAVAVYFLGADPLHRILNSYTRREFTLPQRVLTEFRVVVYYVSLLVYPHPDRLILDHDYPLSLGFLQPPVTLTCLLMLAGMAAWAGYVAKKDRLTAFAIFWFMITLAIESSVIGIEIIYEHRLYLPAMFLFLAAAKRAFQYLTRKHAAAALVLCAVMLAVWSHQRNRIWATDVAFWSDNAKKSPLKERPYQNLAYSLQVGQKLEEAIYFYRKSLVINPHPVAYFNLGLCLEGIGYYSDAVDAYVNALKMGYQTAQVHSSLAGALVHMGEFDAAVTHFEQARKMVPADAIAEQKLTRLKAFLDQCRTPEQCLRASIAQEPSNPALRFKLAMIYEKQGKQDPAYGIYEKILKEIDGTNRKLFLLVIHRMAVLSAMAGETDRSLGLLEKGMRVMPDNPFFDYETAAYYGLLGETEKSLSWLDRAVKKGYQNWAQIASDRRLQGIRNTPYVQALLKKNSSGNRLN